MFKKRIPALLAALLALCLTACASQTAADSNATLEPAEPQPAQAPAASPAADASSQDVIVFQAGHVLTTESGYHRGLEEWARLVGERTQGRIKIEVYPNSTLGNERDMIEAVQMGMLDITLPNHAPMANFTNAFQAFDLPFLFSTREEAYAVCDGAFGQEILDSLADINIVGLSMWENGFRYMANNAKAVTTPADLKGLKIRTMENAIHMASFSAWGADPTAMAWGEVYTSLQQGTIDGLEVPLETMYQNKTYEVAGNITMSGHFYCAAPLLMSVEAWDKLTAEEQEILVTAANEVKPLERQWIAEADAEYKGLMEAAGVAFVDEIDKALWREAAQPVYDAYAEQIGADKLAQVQAVIDGVKP